MMKYNFMLITLVLIIESNCQKVISSARTIQLVESESSYDQLCIYDYAYINVIDYKD